MSGGAGWGFIATKDVGWNITEDLTMVTTVNEVTGLVIGQYGNAVTLKVIDEDGVAIDLSTYTGITLKALSPDGQNLLSFTGALVGGGTGGQFSFTPASDNTFDRAGTWFGQAQFTKTSTLALTDKFTMYVDAKL